MAGPDSGQWANYTQSVEERFQTLERAFSRLADALTAERDLAIDYTEILKSEGLSLEESEKVTHQPCVKPSS